MGLDPRKEMHFSALVVSELITHANSVVARLNAIPVLGGAMLRLIVGSLRLPPGKLTGVRIRSTMVI